MLIVMQQNSSTAKSPTSLIDGLSEGHKFAIFALMAVGQFMALLDTQIVAASMSDIQAGLAAAPDESSWIQTAYLMSEIVMIPFAGWLARAFSTRWVFVVSAAGFTLSSMACGLSQDIQTMVIARVFQGFLGGAMIPTAFATGFTLFTGKKRAIIPATLGLLGSLAPTIGPTLGGRITDLFSWHWLFFVNVVPGTIIAIAITFIGKVDEPEPALLRGFDLLGLVLLAAFLGCFEYVLEEGYRWNWFDDGTILLLTWISVIAGLLFVLRSLRYSNPIVDLHILKNRTFAVACLFNFITGFGLFGAVYVLPLYLARIRGFDAQQIGDAVFVAGFAMVFGAPITAKLLDKIDLRLMIAFGFIMFAVGLLLTSDITSEWTGDQLFWPQVIRGFSLMFCIVPATNMALGAVAPSQLKMSSGLFNTMRNLGGAVGIACINTWINSRTNDHWHRLSEHLTTSNPRLQTWLHNVTQHMVPATSDRGLADHRALSLLAGTVRREAVTMAFADSFHLMALLFIAALIFVPLLHRPKVASPKAQEAAH
jgi:DHA2 family multidrug resistance protein